MQEGLIAFGLVLLMFMAPLAINGPPDLWMISGFWLAVVGLGFGVPTGALYHMALYSALRSVDDLPQRWWVKPTSLHDRVPAERRFWVFAWCGMGALGFVVVIIGCLVVGIGAVRSF